MTADLFVGIDVSKDTLDVYLHPLRQRLSVSNRPDGLAQLTDWLKPYQVKACLFEATGPYSRDLHHALHQAGYPTCRVNPRQSALFLRSVHPSHKTDLSDAKALALMGQGLGLQPTLPPSSQQELLQELVNTRAALLTDHTAMAARQRSVVNQTVKESLDPILTALRRQVTGLERRIADLVKDDPDLKHKFNLLRSIPGIGQHTAHALIALLPELGRIGHKQIASLVGVAPRTRDSGSYKGKRSIAGGRMLVRNILYMATLTALRTNPKLKAWADQPHLAHKPHKVRRIAALRKLLVTANAVVKYNTPFHFSS